MAIDTGRVAAAGRGGRRRGWRHRKRMGTAGRVCARLRVRLRVRGETVIVLCACVCVRARCVNCRGPPGSAAPWRRPSGFVDPSRRKERSRGFLSSCGLHAHTTPAACAQVPTRES
jgi:hypothetical protein